MKKYYALEVKEDKKTADIYIFGDIVIPEWAWYESDTSGYSLAQEIKDLDVDVINVHINSYGGHVSEGLAILNVLKNHKAKIKTYCDGFACSAASVVFMAGEERIMNNSSLLMIHNAWTYASGDPQQLRKAADDLEKITEATKAAYLEHITISKEELDELMDNETWILPNEALEMGFSTSIVSEQLTDQVAASARKALFNLVKRTSQANPEPEPKQTYEPEPTTDPTPEPHPEPPKENKPKKFLAALFR